MVGTEGSTANTLEMSALPIPPLPPTGAKESELLGLLLPACVTKWERVGIAIAMKSSTLETLGSSVAPIKQESVETATAIEDNVVEMKGSSTLNIVSGR